MKKTLVVAGALAAAACAHGRDATAQASGGDNAAAQKTTRMETRVDHGLKTRRSAKDFAATTAALEAAIAEKGLTLMAKVDHAANAAKVAETLRPTTLFIFGNPAAGTQLMLSAQQSGIDLPMKALVFEDAAGETHISYNAPRWIAKRHGAGDLAVLSNMEAALADLAEKATAGER